MVMTTNNFKIIEGGTSAACAKLVFIVKGGVVEYEAFYTALAAKGMTAAAPKRTSDEAALSRALEDLKPKDTIKVSAGRGKWTAHRKRRMAELETEFQQVWGAKLVNGRPFVPDYESGFWINELNAKFDQHKAQLSQSDVTGWIRQQLIGPLSAQVVNEGHSFIVPRDRWPLLSMVASVVAQFGYSLPEAEITTTSAMIQEAAKAIREEAAKAMAEINAWIDANQVNDAEVTGRQFKAQKVNESILKELQSKIDRFTKLYQKQFWDIEGDMATLKNRLAGTMFVTQAANEGKQVASDDPAAKRFALLETEEPKGESTPIEDEAVSNRFKNLDIDD